MEKHYDLYHLLNFFGKIKDSVDDIYKRGAIYKIPCKDCSNVYVGETGRCFYTRLSEHKRDLKPINLAKLKEDDLNKKTALVKHCFNCEHRIDFGNFEILDYNIDYDKRKFLESFYINNTKNSINDKVEVKGKVEVKDKFIIKSLGEKYPLVLPSQAFDNKFVLTTFILLTSLLTTK